jgi:hypothetical protein
MRTITCATCGKTEGLTEFGLPPSDWITIQRHDLLRRPIDCCSRDCAITELQRQAVSRA